jgi:hypothetical protein
MKASEFRALIREEIARALTEISQTEKNTEKLKFDKNKTKSYKVGTGDRKGMPVDVNLLKSVLIGSPKRSIEALENSGIVFDTAFVDIRRIAKSYDKQTSFWDPRTGPRPESDMTTTMTYSLFGEDANGNEIIYDKYEGRIAGGGQAFLFVNGKKQKASDYIAKL